MTGYLDYWNFAHNISEEYDVWWIDLVQLVEVALQEHYQKHVLGIQAKVEKLYVFTAPLHKDKSTVDGNGEDRRQKLYCEALTQHSSDQIEIINGRFINVIKKGPQVLARKGRRVTRKGETVYIATKEEKETDVNIACAMVENSYKSLVSKNEQNVAHCLISNDSDFTTPAKIMARLGQRLVFMPPLRKGKHYFASPSLVNQVAKGDHIPCIRKEQVVRCQLPLNIGKISCPPEWIVGES